MKFKFNFFSNSLINLRLISFLSKKLGINKYDNNKTIENAKDKKNLLLFNILWILNKLNLLKFFFIILFIIKSILFIKLTK